MYKACLVLVLHTSLTVFEESFFNLPGFHHGKIPPMCYAFACSAYSSHVLN